MPQSIVLNEGKKVYFASDFHLGTPNHELSRKREDKIVTWLKLIAHDCQVLFLVGDIFDFWFEYRDVIPKGYIRLQGQLANMVDNGIEIVFFTGNHDMWMFGYFTQELGIPIYRAPEEFSINSHLFLIGHGDGLGPGDKAHKLLKKVFENKLSQRTFAFLHPAIGFGIATRWSKGSRASNLKKENLLEVESEWLFQYCKQEEEKRHRDFYIFGHRHLPMDVTVSSGEITGLARYINLGEWFNFCSYACYDGTAIELKHFDI
jgi:UDP-2,3-diacylglucosamine hydrolase